MPEKNEKITTIKLNVETKARLDKIKEFERESYDETIKKMLGILNIVKSDPDKAKSILHKISESRERNFGKERVYESIPAENPESKQKNPESKNLSGHTPTKFKISEKFLRIEKNQKQAKGSH